MEFASITDLTRQSCGGCVLVGSHGGAATGALALKYGLRGLICHDAGIGLDRAGIASLSLLARHGIPAASVGHMTARIGDPGDMRQRGHISRCNGVAAALGVAPDMAASQALALMDTARPTARSIPASIPDARFDRTETETPGGSILLCDSASQISPSDAGRIVVTGSHGGMPGGDPARAAKADIAFVLFNDAGIGIDEAGISRLAALDMRDLPAACVDAATARIGAAHSTYETGILSRVNHAAKLAGISPGMAARDAVSIFQTSTTG